MQNLVSKEWFVLTAAAFGALCSGVSAQAGGFQVRTHSAEGFGASIAGVAAGQELSYSFWNPAALASVERLEFESVGNAILPSFNIRPSAATNAIVGAVGGTATPEVDIGMDAIVPAAYAAARVDDRLTVGVSVTSPFGLATKAPNNWSGQVYSRTSKILSINVNPMVAYQVNDRLSVGGGLMVQYFSATLSQAAALTPAAPSAALSGNDTAVGVNLGAQIVLGPSTRFGVGYRSAIGHKIEGDLDLIAAVLPVELDLTTPEVVSAGLRHELSDQTRLLATVEWTNWSRLGVEDVRAADSGATLTTLNLNYRDGWLLSVGGEYDLAESVTIRAGYGYEIAPLTDLTRDTRLPEVNQHIVSTGLSYEANDRISLDLAYTYSGAAEDGPVSILPTDPRYVGLPFEADSDLSVSIISAGINVKFR
jgi:long-chain fatty acid transport protein